MDDFGGVFFPTSGKFVIKSLPLGLNGESDIEFDIYTDITDSWVAISYDHLLSARKYNSQLLTCNRKEDPETFSQLMLSDFKHSMQSITAAATALDSFYANISSIVEFPKETINTWKRKKTARFKQVSEVIRSAYRLKPKSFEWVRQNLETIYHYRDCSVHPSGVPKKPVLYSELKIATEWRFVYYRYRNAYNIYRVTLNLLNELCSNTSSCSNDKLQSYSYDLQQKICGNVQDFLKEYGGFEES